MLIGVHLQVLQLIKVTLLLDHAEPPMASLAHAGVFIFLLNTGF